MAAKISTITPKKSYLSYQPVDYLKKNHEITDFIMNFDFIISELTGKNQLINVNLDIKNLNHMNLKQLKSELHKIVEVASKSDITLKFNNFKPKKFLNPDRCCTWFSGHKISPEIDLLQLIIAIQSNQKNSRSIIQFNVIQ